MSRVIPVGKVIILLLLLSGCRNTCSDRAGFFSRPACDQPPGARLASAPRLFPGNGGFGNTNNPANPACTSCGSGSSAVVGMPVSMWDGGSSMGGPYPGSFIPATSPVYPGSAPSAPPGNELPLPGDYAPARAADGLGILPTPQPLIPPSTTTTPVRLQR